MWGPPPTDAGSTWIDFQGLVGRGSWVDLAHFEHGPIPYFMGWAISRAFSEDSSKFDYFDLYYFFAN